MKCPNCQAEIPTTTVYCPSCGKSVDLAAVMKDMPDPDPTVRELLRGAKDAIIENKVKVIRTTAALLAVLVLCLTVIGCVTAAHTVDLSDYLIVDFSGTDGNGYASARLDYEAMRMEYGERTRFRAKYKRYLEKSFLGSFVSDNAFDAMCVDLKGKFDRDYRLSNGDQIRYHWTFHEDSLRDCFNLRFKCRPVTVTVTGLRPAK